MHADSSVQNNKVPVYVGDGAGAGCCENAVAATNPLEETSAALVPPVPTSKASTQSKPLLPLPVSEHVITARFCPPGTVRHQPDGGGICGGWPADLIKL